MTKHEEMVAELKAHMSGEVEMAMGELLKYLGENPERWAGAVAMNACINGAQQMFKVCAEVADATDDIELVRMMAILALQASEDLILKVGQHPVGRMALEHLVNEFNEGEDEN
jgi:hypothetical protein